MTVIAWDGKTLAADRKSTYGNTTRSTTKIHRVGAALVGYSGGASVGNEVIAWFRDGADPQKFPAMQRDKDEHVNLLVVYADERIHEYIRTPFPEVVEDKFVAIGSGRDFALAAMHLGQSAAQAVELACRLDANCGQGVDSMTHNAELTGKAGTPDLSG